MFAVAVLMYSINRMVAVRQETGDRDAGVTKRRTQIHYWSSLKEKPRGSRKASSGGYLLPLRVNPGKFTP
jgi:hypothetical protein